MKTPYKTVLVYDVETSGLDAKTNAVTEIAFVAVDFATLEVVDEIFFKIKPYDKEYEQEALDYSNVTIADLEENGADKKEVVAAIKAFIKKNKGGSGKPILCGHKVDDFDNDFLEDLLLSEKVKMSSLVSSKTIDTIDKAREKWVVSPDYTLGTCCANYGIDLVDAHSALIDTRATAQLFIRLYTDLRNSGGATEESEKPRANFYF